MENKEIKWKGSDISLNECLDNYGCVYQYDGDNFNGYLAYGFDDNGNINEFAPFWMDNHCIDDYYEDHGDDIAKMCGVSQEEMDYEWKMDALISYCGGAEFMDSFEKVITRQDLYDKIKDNWFGIVD